MILSLSETGLHLDAFKYTRFYSSHSFFLLAMFDSSLFLLHKSHAVDARFNNRVHVQAFPFACQITPSRMTDHFILRGELTHAEWQRSLGEHRINKLLTWRFDAKLEFGHNHARFGSAQSSLNFDFQHTYGPLPHELL